MGGVEVEPDRAAPLLQDPAPHPGRGRDVVAARPLVVREQHRAVLERDPASVVLRIADDVRPDAERLLPVLVLVLRTVTAHEGVDERDVHLLGRVDDELEVADDGRAVGGVRVQRVRVEAQAGDGEALALDLGADLRGLVRGQVGDVDVARAGIPAGVAGRAGPAGDLEDLEPRAGGPVGHLHQRGLRERGGQEAELHRAMPSGALMRVAVTGAGVRVMPRAPPSPRRRCGSSAGPRPRQASPRARPRRWRSAGPPTACPRGRPRRWR